MHNLDFDNEECNEKMHNLDFDNEELMEIMRNKCPAFLADAYRKNGNISECCEILNKIYKKDQFLEQVCLSYIYLGQFEEAEKLIGTVENESKIISKLKITFELQRNVEKIMIEDLDMCEYLYMQEQVFLRMFDDVEVVKFIPIDYKSKEIKQHKFETNKFNKKDINKKDVSNEYHVYNFKCGTIEYQHILSSIIEYLLKYFDLNLIFIYYKIISTSCFLSSCTSNCREVGHETIMRELLDPFYVNILGYKNLCILYEMYGDEKLLENMHKLNPFIDKKYKKDRKDNKDSKLEFVISKDEEIPIEETVMIKDINKPNGIVKNMIEIKRSGEETKITKKKTMCHKSPRTTKG